VKNAWCSKELRCSKKVYVLDSSVFMNADSPRFSEGVSCYTTPRVKQEVKDIKSKALFVLINPVIKQPCKKSVEHVQRVAMRTGDWRLLSPADLELLSLAFELSKDHSPVVVSDDYDVQNVCYELGIECESVSSIGIKKTYVRKAYCPYCKKYYSNEREECFICGARLRPKLVESRELKK